MLAAFQATKSSLPSPLKSPTKLAVSPLNVEFVVHCTGAPNAVPTVDFPANSGPRHLAFHPGGKFVYVINEMGSSVTHFTWDGDKGTLKASVKKTHKITAATPGIVPPVSIGLTAVRRYMTAMMRK